MPSKNITVKGALLMTLLLFSTKSLGAYKSKEAFVAHLQKAGFEHIFEFSANSFSFKVHVEGVGHPVELNQYVAHYGQEKISQLDIDKPYGYTYDAYKVANRFVCYRNVNRINEWVESRVGQPLTVADLSFCFMIPVEIDDVVRELSRTPIEE